MDHYKILEFDIILQMLAERAVSASVKERCLRLEPSRDVAEARRLIDETTQAKCIIEQTGTPPLSQMTDLHKIIGLLGVDAMLTLDQILGVSIFLTSCRRVKDYLKRAEATGAEIAFYGGAIADLSDTEDEIERCIRGGQVDDRASQRLFELRRDVAAKSDQIKAKLESILKKNKDYFSESFISVRNGRFTLPVKQEYKSKIEGALVELSNSGGTRFVEPSVVRKLQDELNELTIEEENEVRRILYMLTALIYDGLPSIKLNVDAMETLDFLFAKAKLSIAMKASPINLLDAREVRIYAARHPLLERGARRPPFGRSADANTTASIAANKAAYTTASIAVNAGTMEVVPLDFTLGGDVTGVVVTGPNTGGKTVALKTIGLVALMAQSGLHAPCDGRSGVCVFDAILCDIGDGQSITENLSTFSSHMTNIINILKKMSVNSLVLLDELGSGTDPAEGMGLATAILEELLSGGCLFAATTHYPEIKEFAAVTPGIINARMAFDRESLAPLYKLEIGEAGESCALYIAERLGLPETLLTRAREITYAEQTPHERAPSSFTTTAPSVSPSPDPAAPPAPPSPITPSYTKTMSAPSASPSPDPTAPPVPPSHTPITPAAPPTPPSPAPHSRRFSVGDSVTVYPRRDIGIVYALANVKGEVGVQVKGNKLMINHKRLKLKVAAAELYPDDYDMSIVFDSVQNRKARHLMDRKHVAGNTVIIDESNPR